MYSEITKVVNNPTVKIKIPRGLASAILCDREKRQVYETNRTLKAFETFFYLKSLTTSGIIKYQDRNSFHNKQIVKYDKKPSETRKNTENFDQFAARLTQPLKCSRNTVYTRLSWCEKLNLIQRTDKGIKLASYTRLQLLYSLPTLSFHQINLTDGQQLKDLLHCLAHKEKKAAMRHVFKKKIERNPELSKAISEIADCDASKPEQLFAWQLDSFINGSEIHSLLTWHNADMNLSYKALRRMYGCKSFQTVGYQLRILHRKRLITVERRQMVLSEVRTRKHGNYNVFWNSQERKTAFYLPNEITIN